MKTFFLILSLTWCISCTSNKEKELLNEIDNLSKIIDRYRIRFSYNNSVHDFLSIVYNDLHIYEKGIDSVGIAKIRRNILNYNLEHLEIEFIIVKAAYNRLLLVNKLAELNKNKYIDLKREIDYENELILQNLFTDENYEFFPYENIKTSLYSTIFYYKPDYMEYEGWYRLR